MRADLIMAPPSLKQVYPKRRFFWVPYQNLKIAWWILPSVTSPANGLPFSPVSEVPWCAWSTSTSRGIIAPWLLPVVPFAYISQLASLSLLLLVPRGPVDLASTGNYVQVRDQVYPQWGNHQGSSHELEGMGA